MRDVIDFVDIYLHMVSMRGRTLFNNLVGIVFVWGGWGVIHFIDKQFVMPFDLDLESNLM